MPASTNLIQFGMKKIMLSINAAGTIFVMGSCSADNAQDEPQNPATVISDMASSLPALKSERDINWLLYHRHLRTGDERGRNCSWPDLRHYYLKR